MLSGCVLMPSRDLVRGTEVKVGTVGSHGGLLSLWGVRPCPALTVAVASWAFGSRTGQNKL